MGAYAPETVFSSIDRGGRYAYHNQPGIALWNLTRLTECLLPLLGADEAEGLAEGQSAITAFAPAYLAAHLEGFRRKLGLATRQEGDAALVQDRLDRMAAGKADFTLTFRRIRAARAAL